MTTEIAGLQFITPGTYPDYRRSVAPLAEACWPEFMLHDAVAEKYWGALFERFSEYQFGLLDPLTNKAVAMGNSVPLHWDRELEELPEEGWDWVFAQAVDDDQAGISPNMICAIQIAINPGYQRRGLSAAMVSSIRSVGRSRGFGVLVAPVRPSQKAAYPLADIDHYINWKTAGDLPFDAWLRVHVRAGACIVKVCHRSMTIKGTIGDWQIWTGMSLPETGDYYVPGALNPIQMDVEADCGTYREPNVWMVHRLD